MARQERGHKGWSRHSQVIGQARARGVDGQSKGVGRVRGTGRARTLAEQGHEGWSRQSEGVGRARAWAESGQAESGHEARAKGRAKNGVGRGPSMCAAQGQGGGQNKSGGGDGSEQTTASGGELRWYLNNCCQIHVNFELRCNPLLQVV